MSRKEFHELNNMAQYCTILSFDEKQGLKSEDIVQFLSDFKEIIETIIRKDNYEDFSIFVTPIHNGEDPEFLCYLRKTPFSDGEAKAVYEFMIDEDISIDNETEDDN